MSYARSTYAGFLKSSIAPRHLVAFLLKKSFGFLNIRQFNVLELGGQSDVLVVQGISEIVDRFVDIGIGGRIDSGER